MSGLLAAAFAAGLLGGVHCAGMCGGIVATLSLQARGPLLARQLAFNFGRISSYAIAGAAVGALGAVVQLAGPVAIARTALFVAANVLMVFLGLYVAGWGRAVLRLEALGAHLWRHLQPIGRRLLPIDSGPRAFAAGVLWGWVPCGLVYSLLALALAAGSILGGTAVMVAFGLGTLPNLLAAGLAAQRVLQLRQKKWIRRVAGLLIIGSAMMGVMHAM